jgi:hypothetical protein
VPAHHPDRHGNPTSNGAAMISRFTAELATACITAALGLTIVTGALEYGIGWGSAGPDPGAFPFYVGLLITAASIGVAGQAIVQRHNLAGHFLDRAGAGRVLAFFIPIVLFVPVAIFLGLYVATAIYLFVVMIWQGRYHPLTALLVCIGVAAFFYLLLEVGFRVPLLKGPLEAALGL